MFEGLERAVPKVSAGDAVVIEKAVEAYFSRLSRWLVPLGTAVAVVGLVVATTIPDSETSEGGSAGVVSMGPMGGADVPMNVLTPTGDATSRQAAGGVGAMPGGRVPSTGAGGGSPGAGNPADGAGSTAGNAGGAGSGRTGETPGGGGGVSRTGTACVDGARQFAWSKYAPMCTAAFSGPNGGATSHGVTADEIKIVVGLGNAAENAAIQSLAGPATPDDGNWAKTIAMYADYFNSQFETYGRKVVVETYQMKSDYILADMGRDTASAQADAQKAKALGAFIDLTALTNTSSVPYGNTLAELGVISWTFPLRTADDYAGAIALPLQLPSGRIEMGAVGHQSRVPAHGRPAGSRGRRRAKGKASEVRTHRGEHPRVEGRGRDDESSHQGAVRSRDLQPHL